MQQDLQVLLVLLVAQALQDPLVLLAQQVLLETPEPQDLLAPQAHKA